MLARFLYSFLHLASLIHPHKLLHKIIRSTAVQ